MLLNEAARLRGCAVSRLSQVAGLALTLYWQITATSKVRPFAKAQYVVNAVTVPYRQLSLTPAAVNSNHHKITFRARQDKFRALRNVFNMAASLCEDCNRFDLQSFRDDLYTQRSYAYSIVRERAAICAFCCLLANCFEPGLDATWVHLELLTPRRNRVRWDQDSLGAMFIRVFLGERKNIRSGPDEAVKNTTYPDGQQAILRLYAEHGMSNVLYGD